MQQKCQSSKISRNDSIFSNKQFCSSVLVGNIKNAKWDKKNAKRLNILWLKVLSSTPIALEKGQRVQINATNRKKCDTKISKLSKVHWQKWTLDARVCHKKRNGILLPKLFWSTVRKKCSSDQEKLLKFEAVDREFAKNFRSLEQFFLTVR